VPLESIGCSGLCVWGGGASVEKGRIIAVQVTRCAPLWLRLYYVGICIPERIGDYSSDGMCGDYGSEFEFVTA